jgi:dTDP-4-dehydrorhamnose reductase
MKTNQEIHCIQDQIFSPTYAGDAARGVLQGCKCGLKSVYNLANTEYFSRVELVKQFALSLNVKAKIMSTPQSDFDFLDPRPLKSYLDSTKFIKATDVRFTSMREVFQQFVTKLDSPSKS